MIGGLLNSPTYNAASLVGELKIPFKIIYRVHIKKSRVTNYIFIVQIITGMKQVIRYKPPKEITNATNCYKQERPPTTS